MRDPIGWVRERLRGGESAEVSWWALAVPEAARGEARPAQAALAGMTLGALAVATGLALTALALLLVALAAIYWITTRVLGLAVQIDPSKLD
ncbi:MAG: hypothetical protein AABZ30_12680 [Myxococcota bacterium]